MPLVELSFARRAKYTCFTRTKVLALRVQKFDIGVVVQHMMSDDIAIRKAALGCVRNLSANSRSKAHVLRENGLQVLTFLALLVQK